MDCVIEEVFKIKNGVAYAEGRLDDGETVELCAEIPKYLEYIYFDGNTDATYEILDEIKDKNHFKEIDCPVCDGLGYTDDYLSCHRGGDCCGGCTDRVDCKFCEGSGTLVIEVEVG